MRNAPPYPLRGKALALAEMAGVMAVYFYGIWHVGPSLGEAGLPPAAGALFSLTALYAWFVSPVLIHRDPGRMRGLGSWRTLFLRTDNLAPALKTYGRYTALALGCIVLAALAAGRLVPAGFDWDGCLRRLLLYLLSALGQQLALFTFFYPRLCELFDDPCLFLFPAADALPGAARSFGCWAVADSGNRGRLRDRGVSALCLGLIASLFHFPNLPMMGGVLVVGTLWARLYERLPNLWVSACCHALIGTALHRVLLVNTRIGPSYWYDYKGFFRVAFPVIDQFIGGRF